MTLVDAGSGEGSPLFQLKTELGDKIQFAFGLDIAKEGVRQAARDYPDIIWVTADLANCPLQSSKIDVILNFLSPASYDEFARLLNQDGILIKVVPETDYLKEVRQFFYQGTERSAYSNEKVTDRFREHFDVLNEQRVTVKKQLSKQELLDLIEMTPLGFDISEQKKQAFLEAEITEITIDHRVIIGRKKPQ
ncbi:putative methyltransferase [Listeria floridensis FSL S10-1187]|uniref:Methyltransferase n=1 Tax=Listeria floridensis FSL S10-1187 TaxID=1265817 RepID=A0ABN0RGG0_9LIST|nr:putative methyltransferase [Listeria floridensis FSL S10-1187]